MSHYFLNDNQLKKNRRDISFRFFGVEYTLVSDDGVFSKNTLDYGTRVLLEQIAAQTLGSDVLDLGCGYGPVGVLLGVREPECHITMVDINERAVSLAKENVKRYRLSHRVLVSDGFAALIGERFDSIVTNPPIRAGKAVIYRWFEETPDHLKEHGSLYVVMRKSHGAQSAIHKITSVFGNCAVIGKEKGYFVLKATKEN